MAAARKGGMWAVRGNELLRYQSDGSRTVVDDLAWIRRLPEFPRPAAATGSPPPAQGLRPPEAAPEVTVLFEDSAGDLWLGTRSSGLFRFRDGSVVRVPTSTNSILALCEDREGNLWVGTRAGGLNRLRASRFALRESKHGLGRNSVIALAEDTTGKLWLGVEDSAPVRSLDSTHKRFQAPAEWLGAPVSTLCSDHAGGVWIANDSTIFAHWKDGRYQAEIGPSRTRAILADQSGNLWIASVQGPLFCWRSGSFHALPTDDGLIVARALAEDAAGRIWVGTEDGLVFQQQQGDHFARVPLPEAKRGESIRFLVPDANETLWIGALDGGLYRWRAGKVAHLRHDAGLPAYDLRSLAIDSAGDLWLGTGRGLFQVPRSEIEAVLDGRKPHLNTTSYGRDEGVRSMEFVFGCRNATARTQDGRLWFATSRGALEIGPPIARKSPPPLPVLIENFQVNGRSLPVPGQPLTIAPNPDLVEIRYTLPNGSAADQLRFRYRLVGLSGGWVVAGNQRLASFPRLPPGNYRFEVQAAMDDDVWQPGLAKLAFRVQAAWWETKIFQILALLSGGLALAWLVRWLEMRRVRARLLRLEQETALQRERARIARDLHDQVGANLTQISLLAEFATTEEGIAQLADTTREAAEALDSVVWAVDPRKDSLESLLQYLVRVTDDFLRHAGVACRIEVPTGLPPRTLSPEFRHHVLLVVKEALNNVVKYAAATEVELRATVSADSLTILVRDNGRGFDPIPAANEGNGLRNMRERAEALAGQCLIQSLPASGTQITLKVPWMKGDG